MLSLKHKQLCLHSIPLPFHHSHSFTHSHTKFMKILFHFYPDNDDEVDAEGQEEVEDMYGAKYLPPLVRQPLPIGPSVTAIGVRTYRNMQGNCHLYLAQQSTAHCVHIVCIYQSLLLDCNVRSCYTWISALSQIVTHFIQNSLLTFLTFITSFRLHFPLSPTLIKNILTPSLTEILIYFVTSNTHQKCLLLSFASPFTLVTVTLLLYTCSGRLGAVPCSSQLGASKTSPEGLWCRAALLECTRICPRHWWPEVRIPTSFQHVLLFCYSVNLTLCYYLNVSSNYCLLF